MPMADGFHLYLNDALPLSSDQTFKNHLPSKPTSHTHRKSLCRIHLSVNLPACARPKLAHQPPPPRASRPPQLRNACRQIRQYLHRKTPHWRKLQEAQSVRSRPYLGLPSPPWALFGSLNARDAIFYCKATVTQLKTIVASAPRHLREHLPTSPTKDALLETVLTMRQEEAISSRLSKRTPVECLRELMDLTPEQLKSLATTSQSQLADLMRGALQADAEMEPRDISDTRDAMRATVLTWQIAAHRSASAVPENSPATRDPVPQTTVPHSTPVPPPTQDHPQAHPPVAAITVQPQVSPHSAAVLHQVTRPLAGANSPALEEILAGLQSRAQPGAIGVLPPKDADSDEEDWQRGGKRQKMHLTPQGFTYGSTAYIDQVLKHYRGKETSSPSLACIELLGPYILVKFIQGGNNVPTFLQDFKHWRKTASGMPTQSEMEAHTLGRIVHMEMLMHDSPRQALENRPSLEIALRRLFAILHVEESINRGIFGERTSAWQYVHVLHEFVPMGTVMCDHIDDAMTHRMNQEKKRISAMKALNELRAGTSNNAPNPRNQNNRGPRRNERQDRH